MNAKHYVQLEVAKMLKEKGYDKERDFLAPVYTKDGVLYWSNHEDLSQMTPAPTILEAMDWLEERGIIIEIKYAYDEEGNETFWLFDIYINHEMVSGDMDVFSKDRNECMKAAIKKGLEYVE